MMRNCISRKNAVIAILIILNMGTISIFLSKSKELNRKIEKMATELYELNKQYQVCEELRTAPLEPSLIYEKRRRKIRVIINNMWDFMQSSLADIKISYPWTNLMIERLSNDMYEHKISLINNWLQMTQNDGYEKWRDQEFQDLTNLVQEKFKILQNPSDCKNAHLVTNAGIRPCGWGCQYLHYPDNFGIALALNRTLVYQKPMGHYYEHDEFEKYCEPLTTTCNFTLDNEYVENWSAQNIAFDNAKLSALKAAKIIRIDSPRMVPKPNSFLPTNLPKSLYPRLEKLLEDPEGWWLGQIFKFLTRLRPEYQKMAEEMAERLNLKSPTIAVHIRRGNKVKEIKPQPIEAYMTQVKEYFDIIELSQKIEKRRVLVVTDEPKVLGELLKKYKDYTFLFEGDLSKEAQNYERKNQSALEIYMEFQLVSRCDGWVGTFSSNLGRRHYDAQQWFHKDVKTFTKSLDYRYYEWRENAAKYSVNVHHQTDNFLVETSGRYYSNLGGKTVVVSEKSKKTENLPSFKLDRIFDTYDIPIFNN